MRIVVAIKNKSSQHKVRESSRRHDKLFKENKRVNSMNSRFACFDLLKEFRSLNY
jgi:hypothetical protein